MKFSQYLAHLIQGDNPADMSLDEFKNRIEECRAAELLKSV